MSKIKTCKICFLTILIIMLLSSCGANSQSKSVNHFLDEEYKAISEEFIKGLKDNDFLPAKITDSFGDVIINKATETDESNSVLLYWSTKEENSDNVIHKIEAQYEGDDIIYYHYKNYSYDVPRLKSPISNEKAKLLASKFASEYLENGSKLNLINDVHKQYQSLYDPGHVETWTAKDDSGEHYIVVDLDMGSVILYNKEIY